MDRTTKALLALIAVALWGLLLKPFISLPAAQAAPAASANGTPAVAYDSSYHTLFVVQGGRAYQVDTYPQIHVAKSIPLK